MAFQPKTVLGISTIHRLEGAESIRSKVNDRATSCAMKQRIILRKRNCMHLLLRGLNGDMRVEILL